MAKRARLGYVALSKSLTSLTLDFIGLEEVCKSCRLVCTGWAYKLDFKYLEWDMSRCPYDIMCKTVNPASVRVLKVVGTKPDLGECLSFFTNVRIVYIDHGQMLDLSHVSFTHLFMQAGKLMRYPSSLVHLHVHALFDEFVSNELVETLPNLSTFAGVFFTEKQVRKWNLGANSGLKEVWVRPYPASDYETLKLLTKTFRVALNADDPLALKFLLTIQSSNLFLSLREVAVPTSCTAEQWLALASLPNLNIVEILSDDVFLLRREIKTQKYTWAALEYVIFNAESNFDFIEVFADAKHLSRLKVYEDVTWSEGLNVDFLQIELLEVQCCSTTIFTLFKDLNNLRSVQGMVVPDENYLRTLTLPLSVRHLDLDVQGDLVADTISGFLFRHCLTSVTLRAYCLTHVELRRICTIPRPLHGLRITTTVQIQDALYSELAKRATIVGSFFDLGDKLVEEAFHAFVNQNSHLINAH